MYHLVKLAGLEFGLYKGNIVDGKREGFGTQIFPNGYKYIGEWKKNFAHGKGKLEYTDGTFYEGEFIKNRIQEGFLSFSNGTRYAGKFSVDERNKDKFSEGTVIFRNGDIFKGVWCNGIPQNATYITKTGVVKNYYKENDFFYYDDTDGSSGKQILVNTEDIYEGGFKEGRKEGFGFLFSSYPHYETFNNLNGKLHGKYNCNYISGGYCYEGNYEHGKRVGKWKYQTVKGYLFEGDADFKNGTVTFPYMNEDYFTGEVEIKFQNIIFRNGTYNYKESSGKYHQIHVKDLKTVGELEIQTAKAFDFSQVCSKLENSKISVQRPILNGEHTYCYPDGSVYIGNFVFDFIYVHKDDLPRCYSKGRNSDGIQIRKMDIKDAYRYSNMIEPSALEIKFHGALIRGLKEGNCEIEYSDGSMFKGNFVNGIKYGNGVFTDKDGNTFSGNYVDGELDGPIIVKRANGDEIHSTAIKGVISNNNTTIRKNNGLYYEGEVDNFVKNGYGKLTYTNNYTLKSNFTNSDIDTSKKDAVLTDPEGKEIKCTYTSIEGRDIGILESIDDYTLYIYNTNKGTLHKAQ